jgi:aconitase A
VKLRRCAKFRTYYSAQEFQTAKNKRRRLGNQLRNHPNDSQAVMLYEDRYGEGSSRGVLARLTAKGVKRL